MNATIIILVILAQMGLVLFNKRNARLKAEAAARQRSGKPVPSGSGGRPTRSDPTGAPTAAHTATTPAAKPRAHRAASRTGMDERGPDPRDAEPARAAARAAAERAEELEGGDNAPRPIPGNTPVTLEEELSSPTALAREWLADAESLRRAVILKTILDKPLSLQARLPGG